MKHLATLLVLIGISTNALAAKFPALYCVSVKTFEEVNQINVFTNDKGTMKINLQFFAMSQEGDSGLFDTAILQKIEGLKFNPRNGMIGNQVNKVAFHIGNSPITPAEAEKILSADPNKKLDFMNMGGHKVLFKKYYLGKMVAYNLPGRKGYWSASLRDAFKAGVTDYVCGNAVDVKGRRPPVFE